MRRENDMSTRARDDRCRPTPSSRVCPRSGGGVATRRQQLADLRAFSHFVSQHAGILAGDPGQLLPFAHNYAVAGPVAHAAERLLREPSRGWSANPWIELVDRLPFVESPALVRTLTGHGGEVTAVAMSADGTRAVSASSDGTARVWDVAPGIAEHEIAAHPRGVNAVAITPDGRTAATAGADGVVRIWRTETGDCLRSIAADSDMALSVALNAVGTVAYTGGLDGSIRCWDVDTGQPTRELRGHFGPVGSLALSTDGFTLVSGSWDCTVRVWNLLDGELAACLQGHEVPVQSVAVDAAGRRIVSCAGLPPDADGRVSFKQLSQSEIRVWDDGAEVYRFMPHELGKRGGNWGVVGSVVYAIALSQDGKIIVSVGYDRTVVVTDVRGGQKSLIGHTDSVLGVAINGAGTVAITAGADRSVRIWDLRGHTAPRKSVFRIGRVGSGLRVSPARHARSMWRSPRIRIGVLMPALSLAGAYLLIPPIMRLLSIERPTWVGSLANAAIILLALLFVEWRAMLKLDRHIWHRRLLPAVAWTVAGLVTSPLWWLFPVLDCPRCGKPLSGRRFFFSCAGCGFRDRRRPPGRKAEAH